MKKFRVSVVGLLLLCGALLLGASLFAEEKGPAGPPPEIEACKGKKAGDACSFKAREGKTKSDVCREITTPKGKELGCGEMHKPPKNGKTPPKEN